MNAPHRGFMPSRITAHDALTEPGPEREVTQDLSPHVIATAVVPVLQDRARRIVFDYVKERLEKTDTHVTFGADEVYVTWFSKTLKNWKAMVSTTLPDGMYYEVTYNGEKCETYLDAYKKFDNVCIPD